MDLPTGLYTFLFIVTLVNYFHYRILANAKNVSFKFAFLPIFILTISPFLILTVPFLVPYRQIVNLLLFWKYRSKYWGLLEGADAFFNIEKDNPVYNLFIVEYPSKCSQNFFDAVKNNIYKELKQKAKSNIKIFGAIRTFMGYSYMLKDEITIEDCVKKLKTTNSPITKDDLIKLIDEYTHISLPKNGQALWEVFVGTQPVQWTADIDNNDVKHYPILFRKNHALADAGHFYKGIVELFADNKNVKVKCSAHVPQSEESEPTGLSSSKTIKNLFINSGMVIKLYVRKLVLLLLYPSQALIYTILLANDPHILHGPKPTSRKHLFLNVEESPRYIEVVKRIKKKFPGCTFEDVCLTAIAASFSEYFHKNSSYIPEYIIAEMPALPPNPTRREKAKAGEIYCRNRFSFTLRRLLTNVDLEEPYALTTILQSLVKDGTFTKRSFELEINYFFFTVGCQIGPSQILEFFINILHNTCVISNVYGPNFITIMGGCPVRDMAAWTTTRGHTGICFTILTYDDRLHLSMVVDEALAPTRNAVQSLLDGVPKYLDILERETNTTIPEKFIGN